MSRSQNMTATEVQRKMILIQVVGAPGTIMIGLALYGIFAANGNAFWAPLDDTSVTYNMLGIGSIILVWETFQTLKLARLKKALTDAETGQ